jgi:gamma-glutamylcyclotransferase (GGCT)/AIG2-like uncharacterized protein YtfP
MSPETQCLFAYGSLRHPAIQRWLFGHEVAGVPDRLIGAHCDWVDDPDPDLLRLTGQQGYPRLRRTGTDDSVEGLCLRLSEAALAAADRYEGEAYRRERCRLASGQAAWVYVDARSPAPRATRAAFHKKARRSRRSAG